MFNSLRSYAQATEEQLNELDFTYPGQGEQNEMELVKGGKNITVSHANYKQYMEVNFQKKKFKNNIFSLCGIGAWLKESVQKWRPSAVAFNWLSTRTVCAYSPRMKWSSFSVRIFICFTKFFSLGGSAENDAKIWSKSALQHAIRPVEHYKNCFTFFSILGPWFHSRIVADQVAHRHALCLPDRKGFSLESF